MSDPQLAQNWPQTGPKLARCLVIASLMAAPFWFLVAALVWAVLP